MTKWLLLLAASLAFTGCDRASDNMTDASAYEPTSAGLDRSKAGTPAPDTSFFDPEGAPVTMADFVGKPVLVNLWATWCAPCVKELPMLDALAAEMGEDLTVLTLSQDLANREKVIAFLDKLGVANLPAYQDDEMAFGLAVGANILPTTILYDASGQEVWRFIGDADWSDEKSAALVSEAL